MSQLFHIHPENPQERLIQHAVEIINDGGVIAYPTDSSYALGCHLNDKDALDRIYTIRQLPKNHNLTLVCQDLSEISIYAKVDNWAYRILKKYTPGPYTFILTATREVPRRLMHPKRRTIGIRVPDHVITLALLRALGEPLLSTTLILPGHEYSLSDPEEIREHLEKKCDLIIDGGYCDLEPTTVVSLINTTPEVLREGKGDIDAFY